MAGERVVHGIPGLMDAMRRHPGELEREMEGELDVCAQLLGRAMSRRAPKYRSLLALSVRIQSPEPLTRDIGPTASYAGAQEEGVKPGGKGLPRFFDPAAEDIKGWLEKRISGGRRAPRRFSAAAQTANLELRDRYEGLAWHIRHHGVKASPFIEPAFDDQAPSIEKRLIAAAQRAVKLAGGAA